MYDLLYSFVASYVHRDYYYVNASAIMTFFIIRTT